MTALLISPGHHYVHLRHNHDKATNLSIQKDKWLGWLVGAREVQSISTPFHHYGSITLYWVLHRTWNCPHSIAFYRSLALVTLSRWSAVKQPLRLLEITCITVARLILHDSMTSSIRNRTPCQSRRITSWHQIKTRLSPQWWRGRSKTRHILLDLQSLIWRFGQSCTFVDSITP